MTVDGHNPYYNIKTAKSSVAAGLFAVLHRHGNSNPGGSLEKIA